MALSEELRQAHLCDPRGCFPRIQLIGPPKTASTALWAWIVKAKLGNGSKICGMNPPPKNRYGKENAIWYGDRKALEPDRYLSEYRVHDRHTCSDFLDATPVRAGSFNAPQVLASLAAGFSRAQSMVRIVFVTRQPILRDLSWYNMQARKTSFDPTGCKANQNNYTQYTSCQLERWRALLGSSPFQDRGSCTSSECIQATFQIAGGHSFRDGMFAPALRRWSELWPRSSILVFDHSMYSSEHTPALLQALASFLQIERRMLPHEVRPENAPRSNQSSMMSCAARHMLESVFDPMMGDFFREMQQLTGPPEELMLKQLLQSQQRYVHVQDGASTAAASTDVVSVADAAIRWGWPPRVGCEP